ncbi:hypothetical protein DFJ73DRAFT_98347, partial [Zopfochytrium polystomum]
GQYSPSPLSCTPPIHTHTHTHTHTRNTHTFLPTLHSLSTELTHGTMFASASRAIALLVFLLVAASASLSSASPVAHVLERRANVCHTWSVTTSDGRSAHCVTKNNQNTPCPALGTSPFSVAVQALDPTGATSKVKLVSTAGVKANGEQEAATGGPTVAMFKDGSGSASVSLVSNSNAGC